MENHKRLFLASKIALIVTAMTFAIRANLLGPLGLEFDIDSTKMGIVAGTAFWGFTLAMVIGGPLCDIIGMKRLMIIAFLGHLAGIILTILSTGFWSLFISTLLVGIGNGMVEAACNPLVASLYPKQKTKTLNSFHVWFPGGIVIGGIVAFICNKLGLGWQIQMASMIIPLIIYAILFFGQTFPETERVSSGISSKQMYKAVVGPLFIFMIIAMLFTAATELGTNQWIVELLGSVGVPAILLLVFINGIMALGRSFAGSMVHKLSPEGMLFFSAFFSALGLFLLSYTDGYIAFAAAAVFAIGICYFWPTMLGFVSEYIPESGALGLSLMGGAGMLSVAIILPFMGNIYDAQTLTALPNGAILETFKMAAEGSKEAFIFADAQLQAGRSTLRYVTILPVLLVAAFGILFVYMKKKKIASNIPKN